VDRLIERVSATTTLSYTGRISAVNGLLVEAQGPKPALTLGASARLDAGPGAQGSDLEIVGFRGDTALMMAYGDLSGVRPGAIAQFDPDGSVMRPCRAWLGRVIDSFGRARDGGGVLPEGERPYPLKGRAPCAHARQRLGERMDLGVRALNTFVPMRRGQRLGIFAGSGVGKSVLMSMLARGAEADVIVIGLIGERGREAREFVEDTLGPEGRARSVVITETSDAPPSPAAAPRMRR
jgi:flagellum-specific ATP synthase